MLMAQMNFHVFDTGIPRSCRVLKRDLFMILKKLVYKGLFTTLHSLFLITYLSVFYFDGLFSIESESIYYEISNMICTLLL